MQKQKTMRYQTSDYLDFYTATALVRTLYREEKYALSLLIGCGIFFGLRISDLLSLRWEQLLNEDDKFVIYEKKTNKRRTIKIKLMLQYRNRIEMVDATYLIRYEGGLNCASWTIYVTPNQDQP